MPRYRYTPGKLTLQGSSTDVDGIDGFGSFTRTTYRWGALSSGGAKVNVETAFRVYKD
eukprot:COSAG02_NODE_67393_length_253_cov_0.662338_1_plen_57_part_10